MTLSSVSVMMVIIRKKSKTMNYKNTPEYEGQRRELKPEGKKILGRAAIVLLATIIAGGVGVAKGKEIGNYVENTLLYDSVDKNIDGPDLESNGIGRPDILPVPINAVITDEELPAGKILELEKGARLRTCPVFGEDGDSTTLAILNEPVLLFDVDSYKLCDDGKGNKFVGIPDNEAKEIFPNVKIEDGDGMTWFNNGESNIIDNPEN